MMRNKKRRNKMPRQPVAKASKPVGQALDEIGDSPLTKEHTEGTLRERAMLINFSVGRWYGTGADDEVTDEVREKHSAQGDIGGFTKRFMSREHLKGINDVTNDARRFHKRLTLPWSDSKARVLSSDLFFEYKQSMTAYEMRFNSEVESFLARYEQLKDIERERLNGLFKERDYPTVEQLRYRFRFHLSISPIPSADDFRVDLGEKEMLRVRREIEAQVSEAVRDIARSLGERLYGLVEKLRDRMRESDPQVRAALFENVRDLVVMLPKLDVSGSVELKRLAERVSSELLTMGADVGAIKDDPSLRSEVAKKADAILGAMGSFIGKQP